MIISVFFPVIQTTKRESASLSATRTKKTNAKEGETERGKTRCPRELYTRRERERERERGSRRRRSNRADADEEVRSVKGRRNGCSLSQCEPEGARHEGARVRRVQAGEAGLEGLAACGRRDRGDHARDDPRRERRHHQAGW